MSLESKSGSHSRKWWRIHARKETVERLGAFAEVTGISKTEIVETLLNGFMDSFREQFPESSGLLGERHQDFAETFQSRLDKFGSG